MKTKPDSVVLLDDDPETLELFGFVLARAGYDVRTASRADECQRLLNEEVPSAVVMELGLPDVRGVTLCRMIRSWKGCARLPIIAITGWSAGPNVAGLDDAEFNEVFLKPVDPPLLVEALRHWISAEIQSV